MFKNIIAQNMTKQQNIQIIEDNITNNIITNDIIKNDIIENKTKNMDNIINNLLDSLIIDIDIDEKHEKNMNSDKFDFLDIEEIDNYIDISYTTRRQIRQIWNNNDNIIKKYITHSGNNRQFQLVLKNPLSTHFIIDIFLNSNINPNQLYYAAISGNLENVEYLLKRGANPNLYQNFIDQIFFYNYEKNNVKFTYNITDNQYITACFLLFIKYHYVIPNKLFYLLITDLIIREDFYYSCNELDKYKNITTFYFDKIDIVNQYLEISTVEFEQNNITHINDMCKLLKNIMYKLKNHIEFNVEFIE